MDKKAIKKMDYIDRYKMAIEDLITSTSSDPFTFRDYINNKRNYLNFLKTYNIKEDTQIFLDFRKEYFKVMFLFNEKKKPFSEKENIFLEHAIITSCILKIDRYKSSNTHSTDYMERIRCFESKMDAYSEIITYIKFAEEMKLNESFIETCKNLLNELDLDKKHKVSSASEFELLNNAYKDLNLNNIDTSSMAIPYTYLENKNLENENIVINLNNIADLNSSIDSVLENDGIINLTATNLKGNKVLGNLNSYIDFNGYRIYFYYSEDTFDDNYKKVHPEFFLSSDAPDELKEIYYNPQKIEKDGKTYLRRREFSFSLYLKYFKYLNKKSLDNFIFKEEDLIKIRLVELFGLNMFFEILNEIALTTLPLNELLKFLNRKTDSELILLFTYYTNNNTLENNKNIVEDIRKLIKKV